jgi:hypothetical protein
VRVLSLSLRRWPTDAKTALGYSLGSLEARFGDDLIIAYLERTPLE